MARKPVGKKYDVPRLGPETTATAVGEETIELAAKRIVAGVLAEPDVAAAREAARKPIIGTTKVTLPGLGPETEAARELRDALGPAVEQDLDEAIEDSFPFPPNSRVERGRPRAASLEDAAMLEDGALACHECGWRGWPLGATDGPGAACPKCGAAVGHVDASRVSRRRDAEPRRKLVRLVDVPTRELVEFTFADVERGLIKTDVDGAIVKVRGDVDAAARDSLDLAAMRAELLSWGAVAVILEPRYVGARTDERQERVARAADPEAAVLAWFASLPGVPEEDRAAAELVALEALRAEVGP